MPVRDDTSTLTFIAMLDFHLVPCSCHGQMIWVRAIGVVGDANTQVSGRVPFNILPQPVTNLPLQPADRTLENGGSTVGLDPTGLTTNIANLALQPVIDPTVTPVVFPAVHCGVCGAIEVPQRQYRSAPISPDPTYDNGEVIVFSKGGGCGVPIVDAAEYRMPDLLGGDDPMFVDIAVSTFSVRIEVRASAVGAIRRKLTRVYTQWPGYKMWTGQVRILDRPCVGVTKN